MRKVHTIFAVFTRYISRMPGVLHRLLKKKKKLVPQVQQNFDAELEWKELIMALPKERNQENPSIETQNISKPLFF